MIDLQGHNKGINALIMLPEGTLLSGGDKDRKIIAWDSLQNYNKITETKVKTQNALNRLNKQNFLFLIQHKTF